MKVTARQLQVGAWTLSVAVATLAFVAWGQGNSWRLVSTYQLFPLFGLLAFSLMWSHYMAATVRQLLGADKAVLKTYFEVTSLAVLVALLLHPGLLGWQLWRDGQGLPPGSELGYVGDSLRVFVLIGMIAWLAFLAFEFRRKFGQRPWWKYVGHASNVGMALIFLHALRLGGQLQTGWFRWVWYFYGLTLLGALAYGYYQLYQQSKFGRQS